jgi:hypothetical protein
LQVLGGAGRRAQSPNLQRHRAFDAAVGHIVNKCGLFDESGLSIVRLAD